jgi:hypothetical protein
MNKTKDFVSYEPKKKNRFIVRFIGSNLPEWTVNKVDFPKYDFDNGWSDINITLLDPIGPSASQRIFEDIIVPIEQRKKLSHELHLEYLDPVGEVVSRWKIEGRYQEIDFGYGQYSEDELSTIKINFKVKNCTLKF